jgi:hypothetical protein
MPSMADVWAACTSRQATWSKRAPQTGCCPSFPEPQRTLPGCQSLQEDLQSQRQEFPIRVHRENGDLR